METYEPGKLTNEQAKEIWERIKKTLSWCHLKCSLCSSPMYIDMRIHVNKEVIVGGKRQIQKVDGYRLKCTCGRVSLLDKANFEGFQSI